MCRCYETPAYTFPDPTLDPNFWLGHVSGVSVSGGKPAFSLRRGVLGDSLSPDATLGRLDLAPLELPYSIIVLCLLDIMCMAGSDWCACIYTSLPGRSLS